MRPTRCVAATLLLAALGAVGCSKKEESSPTTAAPAAVEAPKVQPVGTSGEPVAAKVVEPLTFADGKAAFGAKKYSDATTIFEGYIARSPKNAWGHYMLGLSAWKSGDVGKAEGAFEKSLSLDPRHVKSLVNLSRVLIEQKRYDDAVARLTRAADITPDSTEVQRLLGRVYHEQGKTAEAVEAYRRAIELNELDAWSMNNLGLVLFESRRVEEALPLFTKAVELKKEVPAFHNNLGMALEHTGRFSDAAAAYTGALTADPSYDKAKKNLARIEAMNLPR